MKSACALLAAVATAGCTPSLDWREARTESGAAMALFPCRPDRHARAVVLAGVSTPMEMLVCAAGGATFALSSLILADPLAVTAAVAALRAAALANIAGTQLTSSPAQVSGMTANSQAGRLSMSGRLPDGLAVQAQAAFFVKGLRVFQASVIGAKLVPEMTDTFFSGLKLPS